MRVTLRELIGAGDLADKLAFAGGRYAPYYLSGAIGSLMVADDAFYTCKAGPRAASRMQALFFVDESPL